VTDVVIVGAGPAGVSAALWAKSRELDPLVLEAADVAGGQLQHVHFHPHELPGIEAGDGPAIAAACARQLAAAGVDLRHGVRASSLDLGAGDAPAVITAGGARFEARAILIASGVRRRRLEVPGEREFEDKGVSYSANRDLDRLRGRAVAVVGGGDAAFENALILARTGSRVTLIVRGEPRARPVFRRRVGDAGITVIEHAAVTALTGDDRLRAVRVRSASGDSELPAEGVVIKAGNLPNTEWCRGVLHHEDGYLVVDGRQRTSAARVWAAGDVTRPAIAGVVVAHGAAALAIADIRAALPQE
jgi:thioredoxin reductase